MGRESQWANGQLNGYLEREGLAKLTISILLITSAGCLAYTWGYAEGVHNSKAIILPSKASNPITLPVVEEGSAVSAAGLLSNSNSGSSSDSLLMRRKRVHRRPTKTDAAVQGGEAAAQENAAQKPANDTVDDNIVEADPYSMTSESGRRLALS